MIGGLIICVLLSGMKSPTFELLTKILCLFIFFHLISCAIFRWDEKPSLSIVLRFCRVVISIVISSVRGRGFIILSISGSTPIVIPCLTIMTIIFTLFNLKSVKLIN